LQRWEVRVSSLLRSLRAERIRRRFVGFAVLATLIPSLSTAWLSYVQNRRALTQKISETLRGVSSQGAREVDLWMKERLYDVRVFASSYEVSENLDRVRRGYRGPPVRRLGDYLSSVKDRFTDYHRLIVVDATGAPVASSAAGGTGSVNLPPDWLAQARTREAIVGAVYWDSTAGKPLMTLGVPISTNDGRFLGALAAQLDLTAIAAFLKALAEERSNTLYLIAAPGSLILSSAGASQGLMRDSLSRRSLDLLTHEGRVSTEYTNHAGVDVLGALALIHRLDWAVVAEIPADVAYAQVARLRTLALLTVSALLLVIGGLAYLLGLTIVLPLDRMARGARQVAEGDLSVALPVVGGGEVAYVTEVFNEMVTRLRHGRQELERLSRTDGLTGLPNRRHLMETLEKEVRRAKRNERPFSLLMVDVDHFKRYNDTFGHLAGDEVLKRLAQVLSAAIRTADYAARYGGEEFTVVLPETPLDGAREVAERIRVMMEKESFGADGAGRVTLSVGIAEFPADGATVEAVTSAADSALYAAKEYGRNRVVSTRTKLMPAQVEGTPLDLAPETDDWPPGPPPTQSPPGVRRPELPLPKTPEPEKKSGPARKKRGR
jgi:diguanylate cyclase (GGDEF)-like protein